MLMFDSVKLEPGARLIGRYPQYDKKKTYRDLNFCIDDPAEIRKAIQLLRVGEEVENATQDPDFGVALVQGNMESRRWRINPTLRSAGYNGHTYRFDIKKIKELSKRFPFDYRYEKVVFATGEEYETYLAKQKGDSTFLFNYSPSFRFEGSFDVQFPKTEQFSSPRAISEYLDPIIEKIVAKNEYTVSYWLNDRNMRDQSQYTMTIMGSKRLFENLQIDGRTKEAWKPAVATGMFFYRQSK